MKIDKTTTLAEIQSAFNREFPHLRLEFYGSSHGAGEGSVDQEKIEADQTLEEAGITTKGGELTFDGSRKISEFEAMLLNDFGLSVQVFRRSGNIWLQTTITDSWTLEDANRKGGHSRQLFNEQYGDID